MDPAVAAIIGAGVGALMTGLFSVILACIGKKSEEKRHKKELAFQIAAEEYRESWQEARRRGKATMPSPYIYFIVALKFMNEIDFSKSPEEIAEKIRKIVGESKKLVDLIVANDSP